MPTWVCGPVGLDWTFAEGAPRKDRRYWAHYGPQPRGKTVIRTGGVWATVPYPTQAQMDAADSVVLGPDGLKKQAVLLGGHETPITAAIATELTAAGLGAYIT